MEEKINGNIYHQINNDYKTHSFFSVSIKYNLRRCISLSIAASSFKL